MTGSRLPIAVSHGEGRAEFANGDDLAALQKAGQVAMRYVTSRGEVATTYPANPNGSPAGLSSICNSDGRVTILMPRSEEHTSELQSLMRNSYAVFCLNKKK